MVRCASRLCFGEFQWTVWLGVQVDCVFFLMNFVVFGTSMDWMAVGMSVDYLVKGLKWTWEIHAQLTDNSSDKFLCVLNLFNRQFQGLTPRKLYFFLGSRWGGGPTYSREVQLFPGVRCLVAYSYGNL